MAKADSLAVNRNLKQYKFPNGLIKFTQVMAMVPLEDRIPGLVAKYGIRAIHEQVAAVITVALETMNLKHTMNAEQIVELAEMIIDQSEEDQLAMEDIMLFLQQLVRGEAGKIYDRMDIPFFFELFEHYRQTRHIEVLRYRDEEQVQHKSLGPTERLTEEKEDAESAAHHSARLHLKNQDWSTKTEVSE